MPVGVLYNEKSWHTIRPQKLAEKRQGGSHRRDIHSLPAPPSRRVALHRHLLRVYHTPCRASGGCKESRACRRREKQDLTFDKVEKLVSTHGVVVGATHAHTHGLLFSTEPTCDNSFSATYFLGFPSSPLSSYFAMHAPNLGPHPGHALHEMRQGVRPGRVLLHHQRTAVKHHGCQCTPHYLDGASRVKAETAPFGRALAVC